MIQEKITIDMLTQDSVSILKQKFIEDNGQLVQVGENHRRAYSNTVQDRIEIMELPQNVQNSILAIWGTNVVVEVVPDAPAGDTTTGSGIQN